MVWRRPRSQRIPIKVTIWLKEIACHSSMDACRRHDIPVSETKDFATHSQNSHCQPLLCSLTLVPALSPTSYSACKNVIWLFRYLDSSPLFLCYADPALKQISKLICLSNKQFLRNDCFSWAHENSGINYPILLKGFYVVQYIITLFDIMRKV